MTIAHTSLQQLNQRIQSDLSVLDYPSRSGVVNHPEADVANVVIIGGGQSGLGIAAGLKLEKIDRVRVFEARTSGKAGPWRNFARMHTLRTPKNLAGPNWGIPNLSFRRWFEAAYPETSWEGVKFINKDDWSRFLDWYRDVLEIDVEYSSRVEGIEYDAGKGLFVVSVRRLADDTVERVRSRRIVLASGIEGSGQWSTPAFISDHLPRGSWAHTSEDIDFTRLKGKRVGVLGAGASAFDNASVSLESGAASVELSFRRPELVRVNTFRWAEYMEFLKHFPDLSDSDKWRYMWKIIDIGQLPPHDTYHRAMAHENFTLRPGTPWESVEWNDGEVLVRSGDTTLRYDFVIAATGFRTDLNLRPELKGISTNIKLWGDVFTPEKGFESAELSRHPYLGRNFEFLPKDNANWLSHIFNYTYGAILSNGFSGASITGMKYSMSRIIDGITSSFYAEDSRYHYESLCNYDEIEF